MARDVDLGVDLEALRSVPDALRLADQFFSAGEVAVWTGGMARMGDGEKQDGTHDLHSGRRAPERTSRLGRLMTPIGQSRSESVLVQVFALCRSARI